MLWLCNFILLLLATCASLICFAAYRSPKVDGPEPINHMRAVRAASWASLVLLMIAKAVMTHAAPVEDVCLFALIGLAFADIASYLHRINGALRIEKLGA